MVSNIHYIELYINNQLIELESQESLNLRMNDVLFNPTKTTTTQASYSYSFDIPSTPNNDKILDYANNLSKLNKFHARYACKVYADGSLIFDGSLTIQKYSAREKKYTCNLVNIKVNTLEEIFGESTLTSLHWDVNFDGAPSINRVNEDTDSKYFFPLVAYGVFQKDYVSSDAVGNTYTPKSQIDKYNNWWIESFYPSLNVLETIRKAYESKGYTVGGSAFSDPNLMSLYASCNLANGQTPTYNIGYFKFGRVNLDVEWNNYSTSGSSANYLSGLEIPQDLKFPYMAVNPSSRYETETKYNFSTIDVWNMMDSTNNKSGVTVTLNFDTYIFDPNEHIIVIPADGWYKINLQATAKLRDPYTARTVKQWYNSYYNSEELRRENIVISGDNATLKEYFPLEIQLVRNRDENIELIKGRRNVTYDTGNPNETTYTYRGDNYTATTSSVNRKEWITDFPHQDLYGSLSPTKSDELIASTSVAARNNLVVENGGYSSDRPRGGVSTSGGRNYGGRNYGGRNGQVQWTTNGFVHKEGKVMPYDQAVSPAFICGFSSMGNGTHSVMRNGRSWSNLSTIYNNAMCNVDGMVLMKKESNGQTSEVETTYCKNTYKDAPNSYITVTDDSMSGSIQCLVYLNRNDILELDAIQRDFEGQVYSTSASCHLEIEAISQRNEYELRADNWFGYNSLTEFPIDLNLFEFTNNETKISDWITNIQKAFNLEIITQGNYVEINTNKGIKKDITTSIDIDDRINSDEVESEFISYPKEMSVKYKIDTEEYGFELTVPPEHINDEGDEWKKWGDSGFTVIKLNDDSYETEKSEVSTNFSYTYYMNFDFKQVDSAGTESSAVTKINIPVIEKSEYMAEGYGYDEAMKHDGYSFTQRFWYRGQQSQNYIWLSSILSSGEREHVYLTYPINSLNGFNLSYKDSEKSIVTEYFNIHPMLSSNYVNVDVYLTPEEYKLIKDGATVHFDSDLYYISEISGYDPSGENKTSLKLIKKV